MDLQHRLYDLRRRAGLSQEALAELIGVTRQAVQKWEAGTSRPDVDNLTTLAEYFGVTLDYLVTGKEPPASAPVVITNHYHAWHYEYRSRRTLFGLPLIHINVGPGIRCAVGIIAIGNVAVGAAAIGGFGFGLLTLAGIGIGLLFALCGIAAGAVSCGGLALGGIAVGGVVIGYLVWGGVAMGVYGVGGVVLASRIAIGGVARAAVAIGDRVDATVQAIRLPAFGNASPELLERARAAVDAAAPRWVAALLGLFL